MNRIAVNTANEFDNYVDTYSMPRYPIGWYGLLLSSELQRDKPKTLSYFGRELVAFRDEAGAPVVVDAYCPHMGAHLGRGGSVVNGTITCPFHGWQFNNQGNCVNAPFALKTPASERTQLKTYPADEKNGVIFVWFHIKDEQPTYFIPEIDELKTQSWLPWGKLRKIIRTHVQEIRENFCDESHFKFIHQQEMPADIGWWTDGPRAFHKCMITWKYFRLFGLKSDRFNFESTSTFYGPGVLVTHTSGLMKYITIGLANPINDSHCEFRLIGTSRRKSKFFPLLALINRRVLMQTARRDIEEECEIWSHKRYVEKPIFQSHERSIQKFRKWYQQFYEGYHQQQVPSIASDHIPLRIVNN